MRSLQKVWDLKLLLRAMPESRRGMYLPSSPISNFYLKKLSSHCDEYNTPILWKSPGFLNNRLFLDQKIRLVFLFLKALSKMGFKLENLEAKKQSSL